ncbi:MAG: proline--tRNA ligase [Firmicutes bacterium]|nr:proline--tRNA ligase [Bacillota bacterium]
MSKKFVQEITAMDQDFARWYTDVVLRAELVDYSGIKGCMIIKPYGYRIWELIQQQLDARFKETGHENVYMPLFIPESLLQKEAEHVAGFAPEVAWVTHGGNEKLTERLCVRPTSEAVFCDHYAKTIQSYNDLPKLYNQWCSVVRWEKTTRPFLRTTEFLWQEGHTAHATAEEAAKEALDMLEIYANFCAEVLAIPVLKGRKTEKEKFAGAKVTYTIEALMHDGQALQSGTTHDFGDGFARAFGIQYTDKDNTLKYVYQTSWGVSTRLIGGLIMVHGDDRGLVLPPRVAPIQVMIIPIGTNRPGVLEKAEELKTLLKDKVRVDLDASSKSPGWKFNEYEMKGVPLRIEIGPRDLEQNQVTVVRRDNSEKIQVPLDKVVEQVVAILEDVQKSLLEKATKARDEKTFSATSLEELASILKETPGFIKAMWCGSRECEEKIKEETGATSRCIPFEQEKISDRCVCCGEEAKEMVYWGRAY